jgi:tRNA dimethylallyltransferase
MGAPIFIAGPTAAGKSAIAIALAMAEEGEIISVDSMQVYRGLNLGTAKPSPEERAAVPHHLIDVVEPSGTFSAADFLKLAQAAKLKTGSPIFCGGTGLYFQAWTEGLGKAPGADEKIRAELEAMDTSALLAELEKKDPATHQEIDQQNRRRLVRALEVIRLTGKPFGEQRAQWKGEAPANFFLIKREPGELRLRIEKRVDKMFCDGLVEETRILLPELEQNRTAQQALGYKQVIGHLRGERSLPDTIAMVKSRTWQFARRQQTWFRKMRGSICIETEAGEKPANTARRIIEKLA